MHACMALAALVLSAADAPAARPAPAPNPASRCRGTLSGAVKGKFTCNAGVVEKDGAYYFVIEAKTRIDDVPGYSPGSFELPDAPQARTYTFDELGVGRASAAAENGTLFTAYKTSGRQGDAKLTLKSVKPDPRNKGSFLVRGSYRARLPPAGGGKTGEVLVEVRF